MRAALVIPILILAGLAVFAFTIGTADEPQPNTYISNTSPVLRSAQAYLLPISGPAYAPIRDTNVPDPTLDANTALLVHLETGKVLYEKNAFTKVPIASLTKILSALVAQELFDPEEVVTIESVRVDGQKQTLYEGERITVSNLIQMMLVESSNDAAYALADYAKSHDIDFIAQMNRKAGMLGMESCSFIDPAGLDDAAFCTAHDLLKLVRATLRNAPQLWPIMSQSQLTISSVDGSIVHNITTTDELLGQLDGILGGKTGYTDGALGCLVLVVKSNGDRDTLISIILGSRARFTDTAALVLWARRAYQWQ